MAIPKVGSRYTLYWKGLTGYWQDRYDANPDDPRVQQEIEDSLTKHKHRNSKTFTKLDSLVKEVKRLRKYPATRGFQVVEKRVWSSADLMNTEIRYDVQEAVQREQRTQPDGRDLQPNHW